MKKILLLVLIVLISTTALFSQSVLATVEGRGGAGIANPGHYPSFFMNPAGFALDNGLTILGINGWAYSDQATMDLIRNPEAASAGVDAVIADNETAIQDWFDTQSDENLTSILHDAGYTDEEIADAGSVETFFNNLTEDEYITIIGIAISRPGFPVTAEELGLPSGAMRLGTSAGFAFTTGGLGLGFFTIADFNLAGDNILAAEGAAEARLQLNLGYAHEFNFGLFKVIPGIQARPFISLLAPVDASLMTAVMNGNDMVNTIMSLSTRQGNAIALDVGAIVDIWWFDIGFSVFDLFGTRITYRDTIMNEAIDDIFASGVDGEYIIDPTINFGLAFNPSIPVIKRIIDPTLYIDFQDLGGVIDAMNNDPEAAKDLVSIGLDMKLLNFLNLRAGYAGGYYTLGTGFDILIFEANIAAKFGALNYNDVSNFGVMADLAIRF